MLNLKWVADKNVWRGECPICGFNAFYNVLWGARFSNGTLLDVVECPGGHPFSIAYTSGINNTKNFTYACPISGKINNPSWLPDEYKEIYSEMIYNYKLENYRSAIAVAGMILDVHINTLLKNEGEKRKPLKVRLEVLHKSGRIDPDQFSDATITRLSRNEIVHPEDLSITVMEGDAKETIEAVTSCLERFYRWRSSRALPAPAEQVGVIEETK